MFTTIDIHPFSKSVDVKFVTRILHIYGANLRQLKFDFQRSNGHWLAIEDKHGRKFEHLCMPRFSNMISDSLHHLVRRRSLRHQGWEGKEHWKGFQHILFQLWIRETIDHLFVLKTLWPTPTKFPVKSKQCLQFTCYISGLRWGKNQHISASKKRQMQYRHSGHEEHMVCCKHLLRDIMWHHMCSFWWCSDRFAF